MDEVLKHFCADKGQNGCLTNDTCNGDNGLNSSYHEGLEELDEIDG